MKTIIAGSRNIDDYKIVEEAIKASGFAITEVVSGGARGVDSLGERYGRENSIKVTVVPADWESYGRKAGIIRNQAMASYGEALIAVWDGTSPGTFNMIQEAEKRNLRVFVHKVEISKIIKENDRIPWNGL